jgi:Protein of unknown function (DUF2281)
MGNLEVKLARLPPELLQEVEDYVDYLLERRGQPAQESSTGNETPAVASNASIIFAQEAPAPENRPTIPNYPGQGDAPASRDKAPGAPRKERDPQGILDWID